MIRGISDLIAEQLSSFSNALEAKVDEAAKESSQLLSRELKKSSPKRKYGKSPGRYSRGWRVKLLSKISSQEKYVVHNATDYQLTHLLEYGHEFVGRAIRGGTTRAKPYPHIAQAADKAVEHFLKEVENAVKEAGK